MLPQLAKHGCSVLTYGDSCTVQLIMGWDVASIVILALRGTFSQPLQTPVTSHNLISEFYLHPKSKDTCRFSCHED